MRGRKIAVPIARHKRLLLLSAIDFELFRSKDLFPSEFISLTVIIGKAQQIELSLLVDLKLGESDGQRAEIFCDCGESTELQADPARHILDCGVDIAGSAEVVRKDLGEGHLNRAVRCPAITFGMIGRCYDGFGSVGGVLHA